MNDSSRHLMTIFGEALECASEEDRARYLDQACHQDAALRQRVDALLRAHGQVGGFLDGNAQGVPSNPTVSESITEHPGTLIGHYKLVEQIGEGGMGTVFMAQQTEPVKRLVALKIIKPGMDSKQVIARFEAERQALALMDHPNIAKVLDGGTTEAGRPYFVMELVKGVPITKYCDEHRLTPKERLELFVSVCLAVQHAHQKGIIHRDLKPSNVMITLYDGKPVPKVIDFGVAKAAGPQLTERTFVTGFGAIVGTLEYMSPEQAELSSQDIDTRSDIYSLGVLLYELLTGTTPLTSARIKQAAFTEMLRVIREEDPPRPSTRLSESKDSLSAISAQRQLEPATLTKLVRGELDWIVMKALDKDRTRRYDTASALARDLHHFLCDEPVEACPPSPLYRFRKFARRNKVVLTTSVLIAAAILAGGGVSLWQAIRATEAEEYAEKGWTAEKYERIRATEAEGLAEKRLAAEKIERERANKATREARLSLIEARTKQAEASLWSGRPGQRFDSLRALGEAARIAQELELGPETALELRNLAIVAMTRADLKPHPTKKPHKHKFDHPLDPDGALKRYVGPTLRKGEVRILSAEDDRELVCVDAGGIVNDTKLTRNGRFLAVSAARPAEHEMQVWDLEKPVQIFRFPNTFLRWMDFSADSAQLAVKTKDNAIVVYDLVARKEVMRLPFDGGTVGRLAFHPERRLITAWIGTPSTEVRVFNLETGALLDRLSGKMGSGTWHPDGERLALASEGRILVWRPGSGKGPATFETGAKSVGGLVFSHDGTVLAGGADFSLRLWDAADGRQLIKCSGRGGEMRFRADDCLLKHRDVGLAEYFESATGRECRILRGHPGLVQALDISADGRRLASLGTDGIRFWDVARGIETAFLKGTGWHSIAFNADGSVAVVQGALPAMQRHFILPKDPSSRDEVKVRAPAEPWPWDKLHPPGPFQISDDKEWKRYVGAAASSDRRWLATGFWAPFGKGTPVPPFELKRNAALTDRKSGVRTELVLDKDVPMGDLAFSPDARILVLSSVRNYYVWQVEPLLLIATVPNGGLNARGGVVGFNPAEKMLALAAADSEIKLLDPDTLLELATLKCPVPERLTYLRFSNDGRRLFASTVAGAIQVWDLREIRRQLAEIGLDWKLKPWTPSRPL